MARGFIVEEVRMTGGTMRLRDSRTDEIIEVPLTVGASLAIPGADHDAPVEESDSEDSEEGEDEGEVGADDAADDEAKRRKRRRRKRRASKKTEDSEGTAVEAVPAARTVPQPEPRTVPEDPPPKVDESTTPPEVDESTLSPDDQAAVEKFRALMARSSRRGKKGALGWQETTVDGRSGVLARWGKGQFKILHAGGDTYALFYEWDGGGKWKQIACGSAEDLMRLANARASEEEEIKAPLTTLTLEVARLFCGNDRQKEAARERLRPVRDHGQDKPAAKPRAPRKGAVDAAGDHDAAKPAAVEPPASRKEEDEAEVEAKDKELLASFTADLDKVLDEEDD
ncbi:MAG: hypothetical protein JNL82_16135 [Myxococcales bacterium]|nr:hypothetical protein [Myxococcales bacterium]